MLQPEWPGTWFSAGSRPIRRRLLLVPPHPPRARGLLQTGQPLAARVRIELLSLRQWDSVKGGVSQASRGPRGHLEQDVPALGEGGSICPSEGARAALFQKPGDAGLFIPSI